MTEDQHKTLGKQADNDVLELSFIQPAPPKIIKKRVQANGFGLPLHPFQVIAYLVVLLDTYAFYFITIVAYSHSDAFCAVVGLLYTALFLAVVYYGWRATAADPTDPTILKQREMKQAG